MNDQIFERRLDDVVGFSTRSDLRVLFSSFGIRASYIVLVISSS